MYDLTLQIEWPISEALEAMILSAAAAALRYEQVPIPAALTILLTDDNTLQKLNRDYRQVDSPTDVLSFPMDGDHPGSLAPYLGDIAISIPYASRQADTEGHSLLAELQLLTVHGVLHLLGYDHLDPTEKAEMWQVQAEILRHLGAEITGPPETSTEFLQ